MGVLKARLGVLEARLGVLEAGLRRLGGRTGRLGGLLGCLGFSLEGSGVVVSLKRLETSKILLFQWNFNDFVVWDSRLVGRTSNSRGRDSSFVGPDSSPVDRDSSSGGSRNRCQVLLDAPRHSQKLPGVPRSTQELEK